jgi:hypothetical protein
MNMLGRRQGNLINSCEVKQPSANLLLTVWLGGAMPMKKDRIQNPIDEKAIAVLESRLEADIMSQHPDSFLNKSNKSFLDSWISSNRALLRKVFLDSDIDEAEKARLVERLAFGYEGLPLELRKHMIRVDNAVRERIRASKTKDALDEIRDHAFNVQAAQRFESGVVLPNEENLWCWGMSLGVYTDTSGPTIFGRKIHDYKYRKISDGERKSIEKFLTDVTEQFILFRLAKEFPEKPPFDLCLGVPPNNHQGISICHQIGKGLVRKHPTWLRDGFSVVRKTSSISPVKRKSKAEKQALLSGLYAVDTSSILKPSTGILLLDDIFQTGSSVKELCRTLNDTWPGIPIFVITLTHLKETEMALL